MADNDFENAQEVGRCPKNSQSEIVARLVNAYGIPCADVRVFTAGAGGQPVPTRQGICLQVAQLPELRVLLDKLIEASKAESGKVPTTP